MSMVADWYFDLLSPYAYLQLHQLDELEGLSISYRPILFAAILNHHGHKGPAEIPPKRRYTYRQVTWLADKRGLPMKMPKSHPFNPLLGLRLALGLGATRTVVEQLFAHVWEDGLGLEEDWDRLCERLSLSSAEARDIVGDPAVKEELKSATSAAIERGVFGVPSLIVEDELFWGQDALPMIQSFLAEDPIFKSSAMSLLDALPASATRR